MSDTGLTLRQALGTPTPGTTAAWMFSPDLLPFAPAPAADTGLLTTRYDTPFAQAPVQGAGNTVYVRARNNGAAAQSGTVYLFWAQHDPNGGIFDPLLSPSTGWFSTGFTVGGVAGNAVPVIASAGSVVLGASPAAWTPDPLTQTPFHYCLIAWLDTTGSNPPPFSKLPDFDDLPGLGAYVAKNPNMVFLDTAYSGMYMRQGFNQAANVSAGDASWTGAPDLALFVGQPAYDATIVKKALGWAFQQVPSPGQANYLYVRGYNTSDSGLTARVSFFYALVDPSAGTNPVLDPKSWKQDGMTVGGTAQSYVDIVSKVPADQMTNLAAPLIWTPPTPPGTTHLALIAWVDNTGGSNPPPFANLPPFTSLGQLAEYVRGQRNIVVWDTAFGGLFLRQYTGQTVSQPGKTTVASPDILVAGISAVQDVSTLAATAAYNAGTPAQAATTPFARNLVYVRAINPNNRAQRARVYLYAASTASITPPSWSAAGFTVAGQPQNWVDLVADTQGQVVASTVPIVWHAPNPPAAGSSLILVAYVDGSDNPQPPDFSAIPYMTQVAVSTFVSTQPRLSWVQLTSKDPSTAPDLSFEYRVPAQSAAATQYVGAKLALMPTDGTLYLSVPGPDAANTLAVAPLAHVPDPNAAVTWPVTWPANFQTSVIVNYWDGPTHPGQGASLTGLVLKS